MKSDARSRSRPARWSLAALTLAMIVAAWVTGIGLRAALAQGSAAPTNGENSMAPPPMISIQAIPSYGRAPLTVGFDLTVINPSNVGFSSYRWNFGDGHVSTMPPPFAQNTYTKAGSYTVTVTATMSDGRSVTAFTGVVVRSRQTP